MKKLFALVLVLCLAFAMVACGGGAAPSSEAPAADASEPAVESEAASTDGTEVNTADLPRFKIAFVYSSFEDKLGGQFKQSIQYLCDAFNCEAVFVAPASISGEDIRSAWESTLVRGDIDGLISAGAVSTALMEVAAQYEVPVVSACYFPSIPEEIAGVTASEYYLGGVADDDYQAGERMAQALYDAGCRNVTYSGITIGLAAQHDARTNGFKDKLEELGDLNLLADSYTMAQFSQDIPTFHASFPELDGMAFTAMGDAVYLALETEGLADGSVKIAGVDVSAQTGTYFEKDVQVWSCGGQYGSAMISWAVLYNYLLDGTRILDSKEPLQRQYIEITSFDEFEQYTKYVESDTPVYNVEEITPLIHQFNPDVTLADYEANAAAYTLADIVARRS